MIDVQSTIYSHQITPHTVSIPDLGQEIRTCLVPSHTDCTLPTRWTNQIDRTRADCIAARRLSSRPVTYESTIGVHDINKHHENPILTSIEINVDSRDFVFGKKLTIMFPTRGVITDLSNKYLCMPRT